jgi:hypothetical protein
MQMKLKTLCLFIFLFISSMALFSCASEQDKIKNAVTDYIKTNSNDPSSYEAVEWGEITEEFDNSEKRRFLMAQITGFQDEIIRVEVNNLKKDTTLYVQKRDELFEQLGELQKVGKPIGWRLTHQFRSKNAFGGLVLGQLEFVVSKDDFKVINAAVVK